MLYEVLMFLCERNHRIRLQWWYPLALKELAPGWVTVKLKMTMADVDRQLESIDVGPSGVPDPVFTEKPSQVDGLTEMRLSAPWSKNDGNL